MKIVVCIKQVPDTQNVRLDPVTHALVRDGVESVLNPCDGFALEQALRLKDAYGAEVTVLTMGPPPAEDVLCQALARGADMAVLLSSRAFAGSDTLATGHVLSQSIRRVCGGETPDLVLFGRQAIDGDTAQVGPGVSECLGLPLVPYVRELESDGVTYRATTVWDDEDRVLGGILPAVMTVQEGPFPLREATLAGRMAAARRVISVWDERAIAADAERIGFAGSPTRVRAVCPPEPPTGVKPVPWGRDPRKLLEQIREAIHD